MATIPNAKELTPLEVKWGSREEQQNFKSRLLNLKRKSRTGISIHIHIVSESKYKEIQRERDYTKGVNSLDVIFIKDAGQVSWESSLSNAEAAFSEMFQAREEKIHNTLDLQEAVFAIAGY